MSEVFVIEAVRTPIGRFRGSLSGVRADHLTAALLTELVKRSGIKPTDVEDVVFGCVTQVGEQSTNVARTGLLSAGWPESIPGMTVDRKCGSGEAAVQTAAAEIAAGVYDVVIAGGAESMSRVPMGSNRSLHGEPFGFMLTDQYEMTSQGESAERVAERWSFNREMIDDYAIESHRRAAAAADAGFFAREIVPIDTSIYQERSYEIPGGVVDADETIRRDTSRERLSGLKPAFRQDGKITAGNSSQIADGAAALLLMSKQAVKRMGVRPRARIVSMAAIGSDPTLMLTGPVKASRKALAKAGLTTDDVDLFEVNEAFAPVPMMWMTEMGLDHERLNVNGGAISLGHPLGATGARIMTSLLYELQRRGARYGLQAICCAGGQGTATIIEALS